MRRAADGKEESVLIIVPRARYRALHLKNDINNLYEQIRTTNTLYIRALIMFIRIYIPVIWPTLIVAKLFVGNVF